MARPSDAVPEAAAVTLAVSNRCLSSERLSRLVTRNAQTANLEAEKNRFLRARLGNALIQLSRDRGSGSYADFFTGS